MSDLTKILAENQKEMLKLIAPVSKNVQLVQTSKIPIRNRKTSLQLEHLPQSKHKLRLTLKQLR